MSKLIDELKNCVSTVDTNYRIGMRVIKTAAAVFICLLLSLLLGNRNIMAISAISALVTLRASTEDTVHSAVTRVLGTAIGGLIGLITVIIGLFLPYYGEGLFVIVIPLMLVFNLYICNLFKMHDSCSISCVVTIVVASQINPDLYVGYTLMFTLLRLRDTFIGVLVASVIDQLPYNRLRKSKKSLADDVGGDDNTEA